MEKEYFFIANWKMKLNFNEEKNFAVSNLEGFKQLTTSNTVNIILSPSYLSIHSLVEIFKTTKIKIGAQNCSKYENGAYTSQISAESLKDAGCQYCIIGHSECRKESHETNQEITEKFILLIKNNISPIICIGESLQEHENGKTLEILQKELDQIFEAINLKNITDQAILIAYEPIWAIGTGKIPTDIHLEGVFEWLKNQCSKLPKLNWKLLYGGSINSQNIQNLKKIKDLDGFLVGGSSINFQEFEKIVKLENN